MRVCIVLLFFVLVKCSPPENFAKKSYFIEQWNILTDSVKKIPNQSFLNRGLYNKIFIDSAREKLINNREFCKVIEYGQYFFISEYLDDESNSYNLVIRRVNNDTIYKFQQLENHGGFEMSTFATDFPGYYSFFSNELFFISKDKSYCECADSTQVSTSFINCFLTVPKKR